MIDCWLNTFTQSTRHKQHGEVTFYDHCNRNVVDDDARVTTCWLPVFASFSVGKKFHCNFNSTLAEPGFYHNVNDCNTGNQNKNWSFSPAAEQLWSSSLSPGDVRWCKSRHFSSYCTEVSVLYIVCRVQWCAGLLWYHINSLESDWYVEDNEFLFTRLMYSFLKLKMTIEIIPVDGGDMSEWLQLQSRSGHSTLYTVHPAAVASPTLGHTRVSHIIQTNIYQTISIILHKEKSLKIERCIVSTSSDC